MAVLADGPLKLAGQDIACLAVEVDGGITVNALVGTTIPQR